MQKIQRIKYLLYDLPIQKVLSYPVDITYFFSALKLAKLYIFCLWVIPYTYDHRVWKIGLPVRSAVL
ncbi:hypothetical protein VN97_g9546, partial [Penicillium thymicola]